MRNFIATLPPEARYEAGMAVAEGQYVMVHGRYSGSRPKARLAVDIFRFEDGRVIEHWDVLQDEVPAAQALSGNDMFTKREPWKD